MLKELQFIRVSQVRILPDVFSSSMGRASVFLGFLVVARAALLGRMHMGLQVDARFFRGCE